MKLKMPLMFKFFLMIVFVLSALFVGIGLYYINSYRARLDSELVNRGNLITKIYKPIMIQDIIQYNDIMLLSEVENIEAVEDVSYAVVISTQGKVLGHSDVYEIGKTYTDSVTEWGIKVKSFAYMKSIRNNESIFVCSMPIENHEQGIIAYIMIGLSRVPIEKKILTEKTNLFIGAGAVIGVFACLFLIFFYFKISRPLSMIKEGVKLMASNLTEFKFNIKSNDEITDIYTNINDLVKGMGCSIVGLKNTKEELMQEENKRLEEFLKLMFEKDYFIVSDEDNKIIISNLTEDIIKKDKIIGVHLVDIFKDTELINIISEAYKDKSTIVKGNTDVFGKKFFVRAFVLTGNIFKSQTIVLLEQING
jgi:hypothetical protein